MRDLPESRAWPRGGPEVLLGGPGFDLEIFSDTRALVFWCTYDGSGDLDPADNNARHWRLVLSTR